MNVWALLAIVAAEPWQWTRVGMLEGPALAVAIAPAGDRAAAGGRDQKVTRWRLGDLQREAQGCPHGDDIAALAFDGEGAVVTACGDHQIRRWSFANDAVGKPIGNHGKRIHALVATPDRRQLFSAGADGLVRRWALQGQAPEPLDLSWKDRVPLLALAIDPAGQQLAAGGRDGRVMRWDLVRNAALPELPGGQDSIHALAFSPDGGQLLGGGRDRVVRVWSTKNLGAVVRTWEGLGEEVFAVAAFAEAAVVAGDRGTAALWNWRTGQELARRTLPAEILALAAAPTKNLAVAGLADGSVWKVELGHDANAAGH